MGSVQKYIVTLTLGGLGLLVGYALYVRKAQAKLAPPAQGTDDTMAAELRRLSERVDRLCCLETIEQRRSNTEQRRSNADWLDRIDSRFVAVEERLIAESERIHSIEANYGKIRQKLNAIIQTLEHGDAPAEPGRDLSTRHGESD